MILPRVADQVKKAALEGAWVCQTLFQGKLLPSEKANELYKDLTLNKPLLEGFHHSLSTSSHSTGMQYLEKRGKTQNHLPHNHVPL
jgi:hypothetical protein